MTRFVPVTVLVLLAASRVASADGMLGPNGAEVVFEHLKVSKDGSSFFEPEQTKRPLYFNLAHCTCSKAGRDSFKYDIRETVPSSVHQDLQFFVGQQCSDDTVRNQMCKPAGKISDVDSLNATPKLGQDFSLFEVVNGNMSSDNDCPTTLEGTATIWAFVSNSGSTSSFDYKTTINVGTLTGETASTTNGVDTRPPPLPTDITAAGSESSIALSWTPSTSNSTDVAYYQALCANVDGTPARSQSDDALYITTTSVCPGVAPPAAEKLVEQPLDNGEDPVTAPTDAFGALDARYICKTEAGTAENMTIDGLANGTPYQVILLAVDLHGNFTATYFNSTVTPKPSTDFWEDIHARGSKVEGGLCLIAETFGDDSSLTGTLRAFRDETLARTRVGRWLTDAYYSSLGLFGGVVHGSMVGRVVAAIVLAPLVGLALLWYWLTLPGVLTGIGLLWLLQRYRRRSGRWLPRVATAVGVALVAFSPARAHAGGGYQPYWENTAIKPQDNEPTPDDPSLVDWHAGVRVGPYLPGIDAKLGLSPGPFAQMFKGSRPMPMLDVDRILWTGFGQVGVGVSIGYMQWFAHAFVDGSKPEDNPRMRTPADSNTFRLVPMALTGTYRLTWFDDEYGVPVVPYVRGGLAYDLWWLSARNSTVCENGNDPASDPTCKLNKPRGGSLGLTGSIGLAIRAERIDASTAMSMQQSGIQHAGVYAELSLAKVDGFGSDSKLSVGDATWFAGVDFEF